MLLLRSRAWGMHTEKRAATVFCCLRRSLPAWLQGNKTFHTQLQFGRGSKSWWRMSALLSPAGGLGHDERLAVLRSRHPPSHGIAHFPDPDLIPGQISGSLLPHTCGSQQTALGQPSHAHQPMFLRAQCRPLASFPSFWPINLQKQPKYLLGAENYYENK